MRSKTPKINICNVGPAPLFFLRRRPGQALETLEGLPPELSHPTRGLAAVSIYILDILNNIQLPSCIGFFIFFLIVNVYYRSPRLTETVASVRVGTEDIIQVTFQEKLAQQGVTGLNPTRDRSAIFTTLNRMVNKGELRKRGDGRFEVNQTETSVGVVDPPDGLLNDDGTFK